MIEQSIVREIKRKLTAIFAGFLFLLITLVAFSMMQQKAQLEQQDIERAANSLSLDFKAKLNEIIYQVAPLSEDHILASVANDLLLTQYARKSLSNLVEEHAMIRSALISDGSNFIVEAYPFDTLKWQNHVFTAHSQKVLQRKQRALQIDKLVISHTELEIAPTDQARLFLALPLRQKQPSLMRPFLYTGVLYLEIDVGYFCLNHAEKGDIWFSSQSARLTDKQDWQTSEEGYALQVLSQSEDGIDITLRLNREAQVYNSELIQTVAALAVAGLIIVLLLYWYLKQLSQRLATPLQLLEHHCKQLSNGVYSEEKSSLRFKELTTLQTTLNQLAGRIKSQVASLEQEKLNAQSSEHAKALFLANMSHELRTPLNGIYGVFQLMKHHRSATNSNELIEQGMKSTQTLLSLLNDLLDFSKIEAGQLTMELVNTDLSQLVNEVGQEFSHTAAAKQVNLVIQYDALSNPYRVADPLRVKQILRNLISNAVKFTSAGKVDVIVSDAGKLVNIKVVDTGTGMSEQSLEKIFSRFQQADPSTTRQFGGTGLGLTIVKQLAELMRGKVTVKSKLNVGSEFNVELILDIGEPPTKAVAENSITTPNLKGYEVLLAEDNPLNQRIFSAMIKPSGASLTVTNDGEEAMVEYNKGKPALFFVDIQMPKKDGLAVCQEVRAQDKDTPLIAVTANVMQTDLEKYQRLGFDLCLAKPIEMHKLYDLIVKTLKITAD